MSTEKKLVFIGAHPDDESFGLGGTLAHYARQGVKTYYICATRGEAGLPPDADLHGFSSAGELRWHELECAARVLGLSGIYWLGYRDSGMEGSPDNAHPEAFMNAPLEEAAGRIVKLLRDIKPQVVITHDPVGGYWHPDHIAAHNATVEAFKAVADPARYPEAGPPWQPAKLYFHVRPHKMLRLMVRLMPLFGKDPRKFGRNKDIDMTRMVEVDFPVHAILKLSQEDEAIHYEASRCHVSQFGGGPRRRGIMGIVDKITGPRDHFMRAYPPVTRRTKEKDLFEGIA